MAFLCSGCRAPALAKCARKSPVRPSDALARLDGWRQFFDVVFAVSSALLALVLGVALGNVPRGVPIDASGYFGAALFTDLDLEGELGAIGWSTASVGVFAVAALTAHGAMYPRWKSDGDVHARATRIARGAWIAVAALAIAVTVETALVRPGCSRTSARGRRCGSRRHGAASRNSARGARGP